MAIRSVVLSGCHRFLQQAPSIWAPVSRLSTSSTCLESDQIKMNGMIFHGYHGALPEENALGQKFMVDATLWTDLKKAGNSDQLQDTIDYSLVYKVIRQVVEGPARQLQEAVAEDLCQQLLRLDERIDAVKIYIRKPHVALSGTLESVGVQMMRKRQH